MSRARRTRTVAVAFEAVLEAISFDGPTFDCLLFDNGVRLFTFNECVTFEMIELAR